MRKLLLAALGLVLLVAPAQAAGPPVLGFSVSSGKQTSPPVALPSASTPNEPGSVSVPVSFTTPPANPQRLSVPELHALWQAAGLAYGIPWQVLASINKIESNFGQNMGPSSAGAVGWMQFMPSTWLRWGTDADGDGVADPWNATDGVYSAARYLAAADGQTDISRAIFAYNHADWYVREVLDLARVYGQGGLAETAGLNELETELDGARQKVVSATRALVDAQYRENALRTSSALLHEKVEAARLLSDRLIAEHRAGVFDVRVDASHEAVAAAQAQVEGAEEQLRSAQQRASAPSFASGVGDLLGAPSYQDDYVFPVGGGPRIVSVGHTHHDYPAADIAAPEGTPVYALSSGVVERAWSLPDDRCGIGLTFRAHDSRSWTYCHLSYLDPSVTAGVELQAGGQVGLVGSTGHSTGPHLHLQLNPAASYPQNEPWFQRFAGTAFRWQDAPTPLPLDSEPVFAVVQQPADRDSSPGVISFTR